jgi:molecular chaperone DnaK
MRLGIDFGTTRTVVAAAVDGRYPIAVFETPRGYSEFIPGLAVRGTGELALGWDAVADLGPNSTTVVRSIKRAAGSRLPDDRMADLGIDKSALDLTTDYLRFLRRMLLEHCNLEIDAQEPLEAMVAVPANASSSQRYLTVEAFNRAGFRVLGLINEPTAAAIEYAHNNLASLGRRSPKRYVVVYDLGGGTFDTSAVSLVDRRFELIASEGISRLGGEDFDEVILGLTLAELGLDPNGLGPLLQAQLLEACREAKESLSPASRRMHVDLATYLPGTEPVSLEMSRVNEACAPLVARTLALLERILESVREHGIDPENTRELGGVYLVGGATEFPLVGKTLRDKYKRKVLIAPQPHAATAVGLAIAADPNSGVFVREAVTRYFGVWREGEAGRAKIFDPIINKGILTESGGVHIERRYRPVHAVGHLRFLECSDLDPAGQPRGDLTPWGDIFFPYDPALLDRRDLASVPFDQRMNEASFEIVERYDYGLDGAISISIENATLGYSRRYVLGEPGNVAAE